MTRLGALVCSCVLAAGCSGASHGDVSRAVASHGVVLHPLILSSLPAGLSIGGAVELPADNPFTDQSGYSLHLFRLAHGYDSQTNDADLAVFERTGSSALPANVIPDLGPNGLHGRETISNGRDRLLASRGLSDARLKTLSDESPQQLQALLRTRGTIVAVQEVASVPGLGSLPLPPSEPGFATSYTGSSGGADGVQRSIALGVYPGTSTDLDVLDWWYGTAAVTASDKGRHQYRMPAFQDVSPGPKRPVPSADIVATVRSGTVRIVRMVAITKQEEVAALAHVELTDVATWRRLTKGVRPQSSGAETVLAKSRSGQQPPWTATAQSLSSGTVELCLALGASSGQTGCITGQSLAPSPGARFGLVGVVRENQSRPGTVFVFGTGLRGDTVTVMNGRLSIETTHADINGGELFVARVQKPNKPILRVEARGPSGTGSYPVPVNRP